MLLLIQIGKCTPSLVIVQSSLLLMLPFYSHDVWACIRAATGA